MYNRYPHSMPASIYSSTFMPFALIQLLNALFGLNAASQHTYIYSPYISSLPYDIRISHQ